MSCRCFRPLCVIGSELSFFPVVVCPSSPPCVDLGNISLCGLVISGLRIQQIISFEGNLYFNKVIQAIFCKCVQRCFAIFVQTPSMCPAKTAYMISIQLQK